MKPYLAILALFFAASAHAQTINAASCNASDVQTALNSVISSTTTVTIPAGTCNWTTQVNFTVPTGSTSLSIIGAGSLTTTGGGDVTVIVDDYAANGYLFGVTTAAASSFFRLAGITFEGGTGLVKYNGFVVIQGNSANIRLDHSHYDPATYSAGQATAGTRWVGCTFGVFDHNIWDATSGSVNNAVQAYNAGSCYGDSAGLGHGSWAAATNFGTSGLLYMENNVFNNGSSDDCLQGGRFVSRFNTYNETGPSPTIQTHPTGSDGGFRGCRAQEIYQNTMTASSGSYINANIWINAGTALVWGNTAPSSSSGGGTGYKNFIELLSTRQNNNTYPQTATPAGWGYCGTAFNGTGSNWDQNSVPASGYRCMDQAGQGQGQLLSGGFTSDGSGTNNVTNTVTGCVSTASCAWPNEALEPVYEWMDNFSPVPDNPSNLIDNSSEPTAYSINSDYYGWCNPSSLSGCTSFTGAATVGSASTGGVGSGTLAAMPATCTAGVAYWATDQGDWNESGSGGQGELFKCTAANTWTAYYTPYTYPHPLVTGTVATPVLGLAGGTYTMPQSTAISDATSGATIYSCYSGSVITSCSGVSPAATVYTGPSSQASCPTGCVNINPPSTVTICTYATASGLTQSGYDCNTYNAQAGIATGDSISRTEPTFPATSTCHLYQATAYQFLTNAVNLDPWNPTTGTPGTINSTGGVSWEPSSTPYPGTYTAAETDDTALQAYINGMTAGACVEVTVGTSGQDAIVEDLNFKPQNSSGQGITLVIDGGVRVYRTRSLADYPSGCYTLSTGGSSCYQWINSTASNVSIVGYGILDGRGWSRFLTTAPCDPSFSPCSPNTQRLLTLCTTHPNASTGSWPQSPGPSMTCSAAAASYGLSYGSNILNTTGSHITLYKITMLNSSQFSIFWKPGTGGTDFLGWGIKFLESGEISNSDGFDPTGATNFSLYYSFCSVGDNCSAIKTNSPSNSPGPEISNGTFYHDQEGAGIGWTIGYNSTATGGGIGVNNILYNYETDNGGHAINPAQQVGHGINGASGYGGNVNLVTHENSCITNEGEYSMLYSGGPGQMTNISDINATILNGTTGNSGHFTFDGTSGANLGLTLTNISAGTPSGVSSQYATVGGQNVSFSASISGTGVTNSITNPGGNTPFPCTTSTWQPLIGEMWFSTSTGNNLQGLSVASPASYTLNATVIPARAFPSTKESLFLNQTGTQGAPAATVEFVDNGTPVTGCTAVPLTHGDEFASCSLSGVSAGTHNYQVVYNSTGSDTNYPTAFTWGNPGTNNQLTAVVSGTVTPPAQFSGQVALQNVEVK